jgi:peptidoglycan L-alanyl-D-glutamate endopeptidase CwlK
MPKFSQESFSKLSTCHIDLQVLFFEVVRTFDCTILEGYRNQEDQEAAFERGATKLHYPHGKHNHQPSNAVDACPYPVPDWRDAKSFCIFGGYVLGVAQQLLAQGKMTHAIRWGGDWAMDHDFSNNSFNDLVHFELVI